MKLRRVGFVVLVSLGLFGVPLGSSQAQVICTGNASPPPELPVYDQPPMPEPGYIWTPGYWGGGPLGYFWVPGTWVEPPAVGLLWTPGYWGFRDGIYVWNAGYWGPHVGFYGGVDYGFGYGGVGYLGGRWANGAFAYNRAVNNLGTVRVTNVYEEKIAINNVTRVSFNGGPGGLAARPTPEDEAVAREQHVAAIPLQIQHERTAGADKELLSSENHGRPPIAATAKPGEFAGKGVIAAREARPGEREVRPGEHIIRPGEEGRQKLDNAMRPADIGKQAEGAG
jgi:WXXGXW repeat (2 copies)